MSVDLVATAGSTTANAFLDQDAAQAILDGVPNVTAWTNAASGDRDVALCYATTMLESLAWKGVKATVSQALNWPRAGVLDPDYGHDTGAVAGYMIGGGEWGVYLDQTTIPMRVQRACALLALEILKAGTSDIWGVDTTSNIASKTIDVLRTDFIDPARRRYGLQVYRSVWREVYPLTLASEPQSVRRA